MCIAAPLRIAFSDDEDLAWTVIDSIVDTVFLVDILLNFFFAYHDDEYNLIDDRKVAVHLFNVQTISKEYLKSWFFIDLVSILPINLLLRTGDFNSLARIARLPRLYRLVKMTR